MEYNEKFEIFNIFINKNLLLRIFELPQDKILCLLKQPRKHKFNLVRIKYYNFLFFPIKEKFSVDKTI